MSENKRIKPVSFNVTKEDDVKMLNHVSRRNFSGYVKKLIMADIKAREKLKPLRKESETISKPSIYEVAEKKEETAKERLERLKREQTKAAPNRIEFNVNGQSLPNQHINR